MNGILLDKNNVEAFVSFPDGSIACIPVTAVGCSSIGDSIALSNVHMHISQGFNPNQNITNNKLIDFF